MRSICLSLFVILTPLGASAQAQTELQDPTEIVRRSVQRSRESWQALRDYTFVQTTEERRKDGDGNVTKTKSETEEVIMIDGQPFSRVIARDGRPLSADEKKKEQERMDAEIKKRLGQTPQERAERLKAYEEDRKRRGAILDEIPKAYTFKLAASEMVDGRPMYVVDAYPKPGYQGTHKYSKYLPKIKGRLWIDKGDFQWARVSAESIDTVSIGWILARVQEGSRLEFRQRRGAANMWLPESVTLDAAARILLVKKLNMEVRTQFRDYKKYQAESHVVAIGGVRK